MKVFTKVDLFTENQNKTQKLVLQNYIYKYVHATKNVKATIGYQTQNLIRIKRGYFTGNMYNFLQFSLNVLDRAAAVGGTGVHLLDSSCLGGMDIHPDHLVHGEEVGSVHGSPCCDVEKIFSCCSVSGPGPVVSLWRYPGSSRVQFLAWSTSIALQTLVDFHQ